MAAPLAMAITSEVSMSIEEYQDLLSKANPPQNAAFSSCIDLFGQKESGAHG